ncbi:MAG: multicopper oxidase domain-containing protein [Blastococcus sp.]|nr:multicopper oxidase domain-containing protein [Blastococcus sp.]
MAQHLIERHRIERGTDEWRAFAKFVAPPSEPDSTLDRVPRDVFFTRKLVDSFDIPLPFTLPDGKKKLRMWAISDPAKPTTFPAPLVRLRSGQTAHIETKTSKGPHTIHWHGIEGTPLNDGVGKHSFEIHSKYTFQFTAREPGFFFYHCHRNTPLHFEMGLYGALVVDPVEGPGFVRAYSPATNHVVPYDVEIFWVAGAHDHRWRNWSHDHGLHIPDLAGELDPNDPDAYPDVGGGLNDWKPTVFTLSGAVAKNGSTVITDTRAMGRARVGQTVLIRLLNSSYAIQEYRLGVDALVIAQDGRSFGTPPFGSYSEPFVVTAGTPFQLATAQRYDILVKPTAPGNIPFQIDYWDWLGATMRGRVKTQITVTA